MARPVTHLFVLVFLLASAGLSAFTYVGPDTVASFGRGSGQHEIAVQEDDTLKGPCRLIAADSLLYLLDQFNHRVLCYDTAGTFVHQINTPCTAVDMALDSYSRLYFLDNHKQPATVIIAEAGKEISKFKVRYEANQSITRVNYSSG